MSILSKAQAEAVYSAICALNNLGNCSGEINIPGGINIKFNVYGGVLISKAQGPGFVNQVFYSQSDFEEAFGLSEGASA